MKEYKSNEELLEHLISKNIVINNKQDALKKIEMEEYIEMCSKFGEQAGMTNEEMKKHCTELFPTLKRWKYTCTKECASGRSPNCTCTNPECHYKEN